MRDVAILSFAQSRSMRADTHRNDVEALVPVVQEAVRSSGLGQHDIGFVCSGSADYLAGMGFAFLRGLDAGGTWPPVRESHVEQDAAWALEEAWVKLQTGEVDSALVYGFGQSSLGDLPLVLALQLDAYTVAPLWPDAVALAGLQARAGLDAGTWTEAEMAEVASRSRRDALANPFAQVACERSVEELLGEPYLADPLRKHDCPPISDGCAAMVIAAGDVAREHAQRTGRAVWIRAIDDRMESSILGARDLTRSPGIEESARRTRLHDGPVDVAELHAPFTHQELIQRLALGINGSTKVNPSGGALAANPMMAAGLIRIGEVADRIREGSARRGVATATSGHCLQHNLVCVLEGSDG